MARTARSFFGASEDGLARPRTSTEHTISSILIDGVDNPRLDVHDRGLMYGDGVFRTMRITARTIGAWPRHYRKLAADARTLGIDCPSEPILRAEICRVARDAHDLVVKVIVTRGSGGRGYAPPQGTVRRIVIGFSAPPHATMDFDSGVTVRWCSTRMARQRGLAGVKHLNRLENVLARGEWTDPTVSEGLMLDTDGHVVGGTMTNLFLLEGTRLVTPDLAECGVAGVQRERLLDAAHRAGATCTIETVLPDRVLSADAVLLVNSVIGMWRVSRLGARRWTYDASLATIRNWLVRNDD